MSPYDAVLLSCEGQETADMNQQVLLDYVNSVGRVYASHFQYAWFASGPLSTFSPPIPTWIPGANVLGDITSSFPPSSVSIPFESWLSATGAIDADASAGLPTNYTCANAQVANTDTAPLLLPNASGAPANATDALYFTPGTGCGGIVYSDLHVSGGPPGTPRGSLPADYAGDSGPAICPDACALGPLTPQELALEFMLLQVTSCVNTFAIPPGMVVSPPPI